uniref:transposase n=1 Tax=Aequorivita ciconiae TaxID=2494375 RepID=UPI001F0C78CD|nr:transposase [Aequorivita sp. H23M31]
MKDDLISDDFLKQFKTHEKLSGFLKHIQKRGIEKMLEGELDGHLEYDKHQRSNGGNSRNGHSRKKIKTSFGESEIAVPRDREASFNPPPPSLAIASRGTTNHFLIHFRK